MTTNTRRLVFPALIVAGILWGTTVPLSKLALAWLPPAWLAFGRFGLAAAVLMVVSRSRLRAAFSPAIVLSGGIGYGGSVLLQNLGIDRTSVTHAALLIGATPVMVAILAAVLGHSVARPLAWAGFALSLAGVAFIAGGQGAGSTLGGDGLVLASQLASAGFTVSQARLLRGRDPIAVTALQLLAAGIMVLPVALLTEHHAAGPVSAQALLSTLGLVIAGTVAPMALFAFGQSRVSADVAGAFLNVEPLVGAILGMMMFASPVGPVQIAGGAAIVAGIGLSSFQVMRSERLRRTGPAAALAVAAPATAGAAVADAATATLAAVPAAGGGRRPAAAAGARGRSGEAPSMVSRSRLPAARRDATRLARRLRPAGHAAGRAARTAAGGRRPQPGRGRGAGGGPRRGRARMR